MANALNPLHSDAVQINYPVFMLTMTYEYKLQPSAEQMAVIESTLDGCRSVWNFALGQRKNGCSSRKSPIHACSIQSEYIIAADEPFPNDDRQAKQLTEAKKQYSQLKTVHSQVVQQVLRTLDRAGDDLKVKGLGCPRFKSKYRMRSFVFPQLGKDPIRSDAIEFPKLGWVRWRQSRSIPEGFALKRAENLCGLEVTGSIGYDALVGTGRSRKPVSRGTGLPHLKDIKRKQMA
ncbi:helix-turn-helix domain-containing protein [Oxynema sp. CENA135]|uniref:RNA-guided endonuclease InsQ/TnpB family protein n=1 Tax=Oxynema sp. CENA135 TaxID=984206 RepID=UPI001F299FFB|nr:helix-turn-helix domain-containing protein [Oxynema sp. CENA135]